MENRRYIVVKHGDRYFIAEDMNQQFSNPRYVTISQAYVSETVALNEMLPLYAKLPRE